MTLRPCSEPSVPGSRNWGRKPTGVSRSSHTCARSGDGRRTQPTTEPGVVSFPERLPVAFAVCHPECGAREFIVDGSTQECQQCGANMFPTDVAEYRLVTTAV